MDMAPDGLESGPATEMFAKRFSPVRRPGEVEMGRDAGGVVWLGGGDGDGAGEDGRESPSLLARRLRAVGGDGNEVK